MYQPTPNAKTIYVDGTYGSDTRGRRGDKDRPFQTLGAVKAVRKPGDVTHVWPGLYTDYQICNEWGFFFTSINRASNVVTAVVQDFSGNPLAHNLSVGDQVFVSANAGGLLGGTYDASSTFDGIWTVASVPDAFTFTYAQTGRE